MTGGNYANLVASYVSQRFGARGLKVYREINVGKSIIGKNRRIDVFCVCDMLEASPHAAYCLPAPDQADSTQETRELDHLLATHFGWWDVLVGQKKPV